MLISVPSPETQIQTTHERNTPINHAELLMMGPEKDGIATHAIDALNCIARQLYQFRGIHAALLDAVQEVGAHGRFVGQVIGMPEDADVSCLVVVFEPVPPKSDRRQI